MQDPGGVGEIPLGGWSNSYFNDELATYQRDQLFASDALLLGRKTFEGFAAAWPAMESTEGDFAVRMNRLPKFVASRTLTEPLPWNGTLLKGDVAEQVVQLKQQSGQDILVYGSGELLETLSKHRLIDEYRLMLFPVTLGMGNPLFASGGKNRPGADQHRQNRHRRRDVDLWTAPGRSLRMNRSRGSPRIFPLSRHPALDPSTEHVGLSFGQAPSHGIVPASSRVRIARACVATSW